MGRLPILKPWEATEPKPSDAWICPEGRFIAVAAAGHEWFARRHLKTADQLEAEGWLHLSEGYVYAGRDPNQAQLDVLWDTYTVYVAAQYRHAERFRETIRTWGLGLTAADREAETVNIWG